MKKYPGVVTGIVKKIDQQGRIQLQFPWLSETQLSAWAPVAAPMAGKERGAFFMPEVDDEVLVAFEQGDFDHPFIIGFLWNGADPPPETTNKNRIIKTPGGHQLRFEDKDGAKKIIVKSAGEHQIEIDDTEQTITLKTKSGSQSVVLDDANKSITLKGGERMLEMKAGLIQMS
jgi:phage baseplate assembly protein V